MGRGGVHEGGRVHEGASHSVSGVCQWVRGSGGQVKGRGTKRGVG